ncbi:sigma 54-interacting transcriptional regulator [Clostridium sp. AM58-1XD]|uniref:sigma-54 interaction domain-containing protein n=1 Tax=Clostridium sp. AM58-1XD TaxID=2292307 RepID=UPI000E4A12B6|nr:sigma 54-interacting transcriptional regulator [Clostridium sp. AM58-1XD]RGZ01002.1 AAA family ATPase [Clostridium sp. AM58-1XD]
MRLQTGEEAVKLAIGEALIAVEAMKHEKRRNELVNTMVESIEGGIIAVDSQWGVYAMNEICAKMFHVQRNNVLGMKAADFLPPAVLENPSSKNEELIVKQGKRQILVSKKPFMVDGSQEGSIITFQYVDRIQNTEISVRKKLNSKGLVAKYNFSDIIGTSEALLKTIHYAKKFALTESDVLITGESGTGKELFAQSIHNYSNRFQQPFVAFNCAAISENLIESELFGYVDGAFTGAAKGGKTGLFELAHKGTLFMDEIGELPLPLQAKLLRVLQEKEVRRIGDDRMIPIDVRIIAATNVNLQDRARSGEFREDLYYRLDILNLQIPPLRERKQDIRMLAENFITKSDESGKTVLGREALKKLEDYSWPGNIRQLRNICERLCVLGGGREIDGLDTEHVMGRLFETLSPVDGEIHDGNDTKEKPAAVTGIHGENLTEEEQAIAMIVQKKKTKAELAKALGMSRSTLWRKLKESQGKT